MGRHRDPHGCHRIVPGMKVPGPNRWPGQASSRPTVDRNRTTSLCRVSSHATSLPIRAVTFDVGGTLIEVWPSVGHVYAEVAARRGVKRLSARLLNRRFAAAWRAAKQFRHSRSGWARLVDATFHGLTERPPSRSFFPELYKRFSAPDAWRIFEDVVPTLDALTARGLKLGVISNWDERLRPLLEQLKLAGYFEVIVVSREVRASKPSRAIFQQAVRRLGLPSEAVLHVGDSRSMDVRGARAAGLSALLLERAACGARAGRIKSLRELCGLPDRVISPAAARITRIAGSSTGASARG
jgi:putative hydrolase of the HAD superfamily